MSVHIWNSVWEKSKHKGSELLMLLAIADFADDAGRAYPAVSTLAKKCRMTTRNANMILANLRKSGELVIHQKQGPKGTNLYQIVSPSNSEVVFIPEESFLLKPASCAPEASFLQPLKSASDESSVNHQEPSDIVADSCPHLQIIDLYHQHLPMGRRVKVWHTIRRAKLRARWREETKRQSLDWWARFFVFIAKSEFLTGKTDTPGREPFELDLEWIITPANFTKVIEGKYHREATQ